MTEDGRTELPAGWAWATVDDTGHYINGLAFKESDWHDAGLPIVRIQNLTDHEKPFNLTTRDVDPMFVIRDGDILVSWSATLDAFLWHRGDAVLNQHIFKVVPCMAVVDRLFLYYVLWHTIDLMKKSAHLHGSTMKHINRGPFLAFPIPLPPLAEQRRIVAAIEEQLTRLDAAVAGLRRARAGLRRYRAAVLAAACSGRLVPTEAELARREGRVYEPAAVLLQRILAERRARWEADQLARLHAQGKPPKGDAWKAKYKEPPPICNEAGSSLPEGWKLAQIEQVGFVQGGIQKQPKRRPHRNDYPFLRVANVLRGRVDLTEVHKIELFSDELEKLRLAKGDLLIVEGNGSASEIGRMAIWNGSIDDCVHQNHIIRLRPIDGILSNYVETYWNSAIGSAAVQSVASSTSGLYTLSVAKVNGLSVPLPPLAEQHRIVAEVERRLSVVEELERAVEQGLARAERLRQSVLRRAFKGKLVPQDPADEPASLLLERIRAERAATASTTRPRRAARRGQLALPEAAGEGS